MTQPLITNVDVAKRLARAIASDISLYNEPKVKEGIENDTFFDILAKELDEGRQHYNSKVDPKLRDASNLYDRAIVDVILKRKGHLKTKIW